MTQLLANTHGFELSNDPMAQVLLIISSVLIIIALGFSIHSVFKGVEKDIDNEEHLGI